MILQLDRPEIEKLSMLMKELAKQSDYKDIENESYVLAYKNNTFCYDEPDAEKFLALKNLENSIYVLLDDAVWNLMKPEERSANRHLILFYVKKNINKINSELFNNKERKIIKEAIMNIYDKERILLALEKQIAGIDKSPDLKEIKRRVEIIDKYEGADVFGIIKHELDTINF